MTTINVKPGILGNETKIVEDKDTAVNIGSGLVKAFATPAMIILMEKTAFTSIESYLPEGYSSVGIQINVAHNKASLPGAIISCQSEVEKIEGKKVWFNITASDENGKIGSATHIRFIINSKDFMEALEK